MLSTGKKQLKSEITVQDKYPRLASYEKFGLFPRIIARFGQSQVKNGVFLGYCNIHKKYYLDRKHTGDVIRCPICDAQWLNEKGFTEEQNNL